MRKIGIIAFFLLLVFSVFIYYFIFHKKVVDTPPKITPEVKETSGKDRDAAKVSPIPANNYDNIKIPSTDKILLDGDFPVVAQLDPSKYKNLTKQEIEVFDRASKHSGPRKMIAFNPYKLLEAMDLKEGDNIADIGCGTGYYTFIFAFRVGKKRRDLKTGEIIVEPTAKNRGITYAIDIYPPAVKYIKLMKENIRQKYKVDFRNLEIICNEADGLVNELPENSLDFAWFSEVHLYNYIPDKSEKFVTTEQKKNKKHYFDLIRKERMEFTKSVYRILKPGGIFIITESSAEHVPTESILFEKDVARLLESTKMFKYYKSSNCFKHGDSEGSHYLLFMKKIKSQ